VELGVLMQKLPAGAVLGFISTFESRFCCRARFGSGNVFFYNFLSKNGTAFLSASRNQIKTAPAGRFKTKTGWGFIWLRLMGHTAGWKTLFCLPWRVGQIG
jgi:hypothetical protein